MGAAMRCRARRRRRFPEGGARRRLLVEFHAQKVAAAAASEDERAVSRQALSRLSDPEYETVWNGTMGREGHSLLGRWGSLR